MELQLAGNYLGKKAFHFRKVTKAKAKEREGHDTEA